MKLYESERLFSGHAPDKAFALDNKVKAPLPLEMDAYALRSGGLDVNLLGRLWQEAGTEPVIRPLAHGLIEALIADPATIFRRLQKMKTRKARREDGPTSKRAKANFAPVPATARGRPGQEPRWGVVATIKADTRDTLRFAAHHLELGAGLVHVYLDTPNPEAAAILSRDPRVTVITCDAEYWAASGKRRMEAHQLRQVYNATQSLRHRAKDIDWLAHIDADEFLLPDRPIPTLLADVPPDAALAHVNPVEALASPDGQMPAAFKTTHGAAGVKKAAIQDIYPTFGMHLYGGFLSHASGKVFARTGIPDTRLGIHTLKYKGADVSNKAQLPDCVLAHLHAPSWETFLRHLPFRRSLGSYAKQSERPGRLGVADILGFLEAEEGEDGLRAFFDEVCRDTPELRRKLAARGMLIERQLDLDAAVDRVFRGRAA